MVLKIGMKQHQPLDKNYRKSYGKSVVSMQACKVRTEADSPNIWFKLKPNRSLRDDLTQIIESDHDSHPVRHSHVHLLTLYRNLCTSALLARKQWRSQSARSHACVDQFLHMHAVYLHAIPHILAVISDIKVGFECPDHLINYFLSKYKYPQCLYALQVMQILYGRSDESPHSRILNVQRSHSSSIGSYIFGNLQLFWISCRHVTICETPRCP